MIALILTVSCGDDSSVAGSDSSGTSATVNQLSLNAVSANSVTLSWEALTIDGVMPDRSVSYRVYATTNGENGLAVVTNMVNDQGFNYTSDVIGLKEGVLYTLIVKAIGVSDGQTKAMASIPVVPTGDAFYSDAAPAENLIVSITAVSNVSATELSVTWVNNPKAVAYIIQAVEDESDLSGSLTSAKGDKKQIIVCNKDLGEICDKVEVVGGSLNYKISQLKGGSKYTLTVMPFSFKDLIGLKTIDKDGEKIKFVDAVSSLINDGESTLFKQAQKVKAGINDQAVVAKIKKEVPVTYGAVGSPVNVTAKSYKGEIYVTWGSAPNATGYEIMLTNVTVGGSAVKQTVDEIFGTKWMAVFYS